MKQRKAPVAKKKAAVTATGKKKRGLRRNPSSQRPVPFPVVGIGGSAGGLEAFSTLLEHLPPNLGMAYVYIQHLSPHHESFLPQILQRKTKMPVLKVADQLPLQKDHVYVIPEQNFVTISNASLHLRKLSKNDFAHSIDHFLTSLAPLYQQNAIGIILSGTGSDGSLGLMAIKAEGGITFSQDSTAQYHGMPQHAADLGYVDFVMPPEKIARELASLVKHPYSVTTVNEYLEENKSDLKKIHLLMHSKRGVDFSHYKQTTIHRRIMRRMALNRLKDLEAYAQLLRESKQEVDALYQDLLITVTNFFRDTAMYQVLVSKVLPALFKSRKSSDPIRIWIPGCATGEEAVSFAIVILEYLGEKALLTPIQIFATDLNEKAIERARSGMYMKSAVQNISAQRLRRFFIKTDGQFQVVKGIRDMCIFAPHNLLKDPPFSRMDIISCQNVLIYLEAVPQNKIMQAFHYALKPTGYLLLGKSETIGNATDLFEQPFKQHKLYSRRFVAATPQLDFSLRSHPPPDIPREHSRHFQTQTKEPDLEKDTDKILLSRFVPASVLVNKDLEILRFRGPTSKYIEPASGKASLHLLKMIKEEIAFDLRTVIHRAKREGKSARKDGIVMGSIGDTQEITIEVIPLPGPGGDLYYLIAFREVLKSTAPAARVTNRAKSKTGADIGEKRLKSLEVQLKESRDHIKIITEDFEATRVELQSANEEILSSNEELQSINEELETSKEELQSTNEELTTINEELQIRNTELKEAGDYARAIVETMHDSLVMLTADLKVNNANKSFYQTFQVTPEEIEGFYFFEIMNGQWHLPELKSQLKMVQSRSIPVYNFEVTRSFPRIGNKILLLNAYKFEKKEGADSTILLAIQDLTDLKVRREQLRRLNRKNLTEVIKGLEQQVVSLENQITDSNAGNSKRLIRELHEKIQDLNQLISELSEMQI